MKSPIIIGGKEILKDTFTGSSLFYKDYTYGIANASMLDIAAAIGNARNAQRASLESRVQCLRTAASSFSYTDEDVEHAVRILGMPISLIKEYFESIPAILRGLPDAVGARFNGLPEQLPYLAEKLTDETYKLLVPENGFCYVVTPGNDVRAAAMVAANLCYHGIPFIIKASKEDAAAPLLIKALLDGGFSPGFCNLLYFDSSAADAGKKHFKILDACSTIWTFGSDETVDNVLRYEVKERKVFLDVTDIVQEGDGPIKLSLPDSDLALKSRIVIKEEKADHFQGKRVLRHGCGNCAMIVGGEFDDLMTDMLTRSFGYAIGCNAVKSVMVVNSDRWLIHAAEYLAGLVTGDPLDERTQVGYVNPQNLDYLDNLLNREKAKVNVYGGKRLSPYQATPMLIHTQARIDGLFGQEIPAYVLSVRHCEAMDEAVQQINSYTGKNLRLVVSFINVAHSDVIKEFGKVKAHAIFVNQPTATVVPYFHEGNDYALKLSQERLLIYHESNY